MALFQKGFQKQKQIENFFFIKLCLLIMSANDELNKMLYSLAQVDRLHNRITSLPFIDIFIDISNTILRWIGLQDRIERCM